MGLFCFYTLADISTAADWLLAHLGNCKIVLLEGDVGAGKTTLVKILAQKLGGCSSFSSPSYALVNEYATRDDRKIFHLDLYRLATLQEAIHIGVEDYLWSGDYCLIEWPNVILPLLRQQEFVHVRISHEEAGRTMTIISNSNDVLQQT